MLPRLSEAALDGLESLGVRFLGSCSIESATVDDAGTVVHTSTHGDIGCDVLVSAAGFRSSLLPELVGPDSRALTLEADEQLRVLGHERLWACGDCVSFPHPRWGRISIPHWDHALWSGRHVADAILGSSAPYVREPYFFSDIGSVRIQQVGVAAAAVEWSEDGGLAIGLDSAGAPACVVLLNSPARLREARELLAARPDSSSPSNRRRHIMSVSLIVDPDTCIGSAECVALDPEAVELDESGTGSRSRVSSSTRSAPRASATPARSGR